MEILNYRLDISTELWRRCQAGKNQLLGYKFNFLHAVDGEFLRKVFLGFVFAWQRQRMSPRFSLSFGMGSKKRKIVWAFHRCWYFPHLIFSQLSHSIFISSLSRPRMQFINLSRAINSFCFFATSLRDTKRDFRWLRAMRNEITKTSGKLDLSTIKVNSFSTRCRILSASCDSTFATISI